MSTDEQEHGPAAQREQIEAWARRTGAAVSSWHEERVSGGAALERRPVLQRAVAAMRSAGAGILIASRVCRLSRDVHFALQLQALVRECGGVLRTADGLIDGEGPEAELMRVVPFLMASMHRVLIKLQTTEALAVLRQRNLRHSRHPPFGWELGPGKTLRPAPHEVGAIRRIVQLRREGVGPVEVVRILEREGWRPRATRWHRSIVDRIWRRSVG